MSSDRRAIELEVEVLGTPEEVWQAIATGPGVTSWYVPHTIEERAGGAMTASFGPGPEMQVPGRVAAWEPPNRVVFDGGEDVDGLAFEWTVEARDGGTCVVRLVNSGFGTGAEWDAQYDGMAEGWPLFLLNLQLHLAHFGGQTAVPVMPTAMWPGPRQATWETLSNELALPDAAQVGDTVDIGATDSPSLSGQVVDVAPNRLALLLEGPAPGTAFLAVEGEGEAIGVSVWSYLYGEGGAVAAARDEPEWQRWLSDRAISA